MKKYNWILSTCLIFYSNLTASVLTISPISVPSDIAGIYKIKSAVASFTNGSTLGLTEAQLNGSKFVISTDGIIASVTVYNGEVISTTFGYFTNLTNTTATVYNLSDAASYAKPYTKIGNTLSVTTTTLEFTEIDTYEKIATIDSAFIYTESDLINSVDSTKLLCKENPTLCGIQEVKTITTEDISNLESGWHLVGTSQAITDLSIFDTAKVVWAWNNGWKFYSPIQSIQETIASSLSYTSLDQIDAQKGFWILKE